MIIKIDNKDIITTFYINFINKISDDVEKEYLTSIFNKIKKKFVQALDGNDRLLYINFAREYLDLDVINIIK